MDSVLIPTKDPVQLERFYREGLGLALIQRTFKREDSNQASRCFQVGDRELHIARPRAHVAEMLGGIDPVSRGHYALRVEDVVAVVGRLRELDTKYAVSGPWAVDAWRQVYFEDPDGNVVECHQVVE